MIRLSQPLSKCFRKLFFSTCLNAVPLQIPASNYRGIIGWAANGNMFRERKKRNSFEINQCWFRPRTKMCPRQIKTWFYNFLINHTMTVLFFLSSELTAERFPGHLSFVKTNKTPFVNKKLERVHGIQSASSPSLFGPVITRTARRLSTLLPYVNLWLWGIILMTL